MLDRSDLAALLRVAVGFALATALALWSIGIIVLARLIWETT